MKRSDWPERGDLAVIKIRKVQNFGAIADLEEYKGRQGFIHISQISSSWIKNIRSFVSPGQIRVAQVKGLDRAKETIDLSLRNVSSQQEKQKMTDWKREKRADKLFERLCHELKEEFKTSYTDIARLLEDEFGDLLSAFENAASEGEKAFEDINIPLKWKKAITKYAKENITIQEVEIKGDLILMSNSGDGVNNIKQALEKVTGVNKDITIEYIAAPRYRIQVSAKDYPAAEKIMSKATKAAIDYIESIGGEGSFERIKA